MDNAIIQTPKPKRRWLVILTAVLLLIALMTGIFVFLRQTVFSARTLKNTRRMSETITAMYDDALAGSDKTVRAESSKSFRRTERQEQYIFYISPKDEAAISSSISEMNAIFLYTDTAYDQTVDMVTFWFPFEEVDIVDADAPGGSLQCRIVHELIHTYTSFDPNEVWSPDEAEPNWGHTNLPPDSPFLPEEGVSAVSLRDGSCLLHLSKNEFTAQSFSLTILYDPESQLSSDISEEAS